MDTFYEITHLDLVIQPVVTRLHNLAVNLDRTRLLDMLGAETT